MSRHNFKTIDTMCDVFSLANPPKAPKKKESVRSRFLKSIRPLQLPFSPPAAPKKEKGMKKKVDLTPIPFQWEHVSWVDEANYLADYVRPKFSNHKPEWILEETDLDFLKNLYELYFPCSQPLNIFEEAFLSLMRDIITFRIEELSRSLL